MKQKVRATKQEVLKVIKARDAIDIMDLVNTFGYSYAGAKIKLYRLEKAGLVEKLGIRPGAYCLTNEGHRRVEYYERERRQT